MKLLKDLQKALKTHHIIALLGAVILIYVFMQYSNKKYGSLDSMMNTPNSSKGKMPSLAMNNVAQPANPAGENEQFSPATGLHTQTHGLPPSCAMGNVPNPAELLPKDENTEWARLNPSGNNNLQNVNLLKAGYHAGIDTVGSSLRNANLQVRSEPPNPTSKVSPWMNTTIEPDLMRVPLELGCGSQ